MPDAVKILLFLGCAFLCLAAAIAFPTVAFTFGWFACMSYHLIFFWDKLSK